MSLVSLSQIIVGKSLSVSLIKESSESSKSFIQLLLFFPHLICIILRFLREGKSFYRTDSSLNPQLTKLVFCIQGIHRFKLFAQSGEDDQRRKKDAEDASRGRLMTREILFEGKKRILGFFTGYKESKEHEDSLVLHFLSSFVWWWLWWRKEFLTGWDREL